MVKEALEILLEARKLDTASPEELEAECRRLGVKPGEIIRAMGRQCVALRPSANKDAEEENKRLRALLEVHGPEGRNFTNEQVVSLRLQMEVASAALLFYAEKKHFGTVACADGARRTEIIDTGAIASEALKTCSASYSVLKGADPDGTLTPEFVEATGYSGPLAGHPHAPGPNPADTCASGPNTGSPYGPIGTRIP